MNTCRRGIGVSLSLLVVVMLMAALMTTPASADGNPKVIPNHGTLYADLSINWWMWAINEKKMADIPYFNTGGPVDISTNQSGKIWFLAGAFVDPNHADYAVIRSGTVPVGTKLFFPIVNAVNDYPCPPEWGFEPNPGESLEDFLQRTGNDYLDAVVPDPSTLFVEVDGVQMTNLSSYRFTSSMFIFTTDYALHETGYDLCITGTPQPGVSVGYWILLAPLSAGTHTIHFGVPSARQDITYRITVVPD